MKSRAIGRTYRIITPAHALHLNEDVWCLKQCSDLLSLIDPANLADDIEDGRKQIRWAKATVNACRRYAQDKLRHEYLIEDRLLQTKIERTHRKRIQLS